MRFPILGINFKQLELFEFDFNAIYECCFYNDFYVTEYSDCFIIYNDNTTFLIR